MGWSTTPARKAKIANAEKKRQPFTWPGRCRDVGGGALHPSVPADISSTAAYFLYPLWLCAETGPRPRLNAGLLSARLRLPPRLRQLLRPLRLAAPLRRSAPLRRPIASRVRRIERLALVRFQTNDGSGACLHRIMKCERMLRLSVQPAGELVGDGDLIPLHR